MYVKVAGLVYLGAYAGVTQPNIKKTQYKDVPWTFAIVFETLSATFQR